jgi:hypothetical protein
MISRVWRLARKKLALQLYEKEPNVIKKDWCTTTLKNFVIDGDVPEKPSTSLYSLMGLE